MKITEEMAHEVAAATARTLARVRNRDPSYYREKWFAEGGPDWAADWFRRFAPLFIAHAREADVYPGDDDYWSCEAVATEEFVGASWGIRARGPLGDLTVKLWAYEDEP